MAEPSEVPLGWIGTGRMGLALCRRLLEAGCDLAVYNRTRAKAEPLVPLGARLVDRPVDLADREVVFVMVADPRAFLAVTVGEDGLLTAPDAPAVIVDSSTVGPEESARVREAAAEKGAALLAAPVSGNPKAVAAGKAACVVSGPRAAFERARPFLERYGAGVTYVGEGEVARLVKLAHNLYLGVVIQALAEVTVLAEKAGVARADFLEFLNRSPMGSVFTGYKAPAFVSLDFHPTFTGHLLRKDLELGLAAAGDLDVPMATVATAHEKVVGLVGLGLGDGDFAVLLDLQARLSGLELVPEDREVSDGLSDGA